MKTSYTNNEENMTYTVNAVRFIDSEGNDITSDFTSYEGEQCGMVCEYIGEACEARGITIVNANGQAITGADEALCDGSCWHGAGF